MTTGGNVPRQLHGLKEDVERMKSHTAQIVVYCVLFTATHFVNKYVLSVLKFQYPTIFQGWQTLVGFLMISLLITAKHLPPMMENGTKYDVANWLPGMMFFVTSIYSGSKSLAKLSFPVFMCLHNLVTVILCTGQLAIYRQLTSVFSYIMMMILVVTSILVGLSDPDFVSEGYYWMCIHILSTGALGLYTKFNKGRLKLNAHEKLYCNYLYSVIVLAPSSYFLGDQVEAGKYPYFYFSKFYIGCIMSGVFGVFLSLSNIKLVENNPDKAEFSKINGVAKLIASVTSLLFFDFSVTANNVLWLTVNQLAALVCEDSTNIEDTEIFTSTSNDGPTLLQKRNDLTHEYIKVQIS